MVEFLEKVLAFSLKLDLVFYHQSLAEEWGFFCVFNKKRKVFEVQENSDLHKRESLKYHESFAILVYEGSV